MGDPFFPIELGDVIGDSTKRQINDLARIGRDVWRAGMHQIPMEHDDGPGRPRWRHNATLIRKLTDFRLVQRPQRVRRGGKIMARF